MQLLPVPVIGVIYNYCIINDSLSLACCCKRTNKAFQKSLAAILSNNNYLDVFKVFKHTNSETVLKMLDNNCFDHFAALKMANTLHYFTRNENILIIEKILEYGRVSNKDYIKFPQDIDMIVMQHKYGFRLQFRNVKKFNAKLILGLYYYGIIGEYWFALLGEIHQTEMPLRRHDILLKCKLDKLETVDDSVKLELINRKQLQMFINAGVPHNELVPNDVFKKDRDLLDILFSAEGVLDYIQIAKYLFRNRDYFNEDANIIKMIPGNEVKIYNIVKLLQEDVMQYFEFADGDLIMFGKKIININRIVKEICKIGSVNLIKKINSNCAVNIKAKWLKDRLFTNSLFVANILNLDVFAASAILFHDFDDIYQVCDKFDWKINKIGIKKRYCNFLNNNAKRAKKFN